MDVFNLTKEELLKLIQSYCLDHYFTESDIKWIRYESMVEKARNIMDDASKNMEKYHSVANLDSYLKESDKFTQGMKLWDEAQIFLNGRMEGEKMP